MAKIRISGFQDLVSVENHKAIELQDRFRAGQIRGEEIFTIGNITFKGRDLKSVIVDEAPEEEANLQRYKEFYDNRRKFLALTPKEKAEKNSWGHFKMFHKAVREEMPSEDLKPEVRKSAEEFYRNNPDWLCVSIKHWQEYLKLPKNYKMENHAFRILERIEINNLDDIRKDKIYQEENGRGHYIGKRARNNE